MAEAEKDPPGQERWKLWDLARILSLNGLRWETHTGAKVWALGNLIELQFLASLSQAADDAAMARAKEKAKAYAE